MTNQEHLITPPPELVQQWLNADAEKGLFAESLAAKAAQWGADQELEACCDHIHTLHGKHRADWLRDMRRPKLPSLKEQALEYLEQIHANAYSMGMGFDPSIIRRALEQLDD
jgi:hypothetical protein